MSDLRPMRWFIRWGSRTLGYDYGFDVGNLHVIDYRLWLADIPIRRFTESSRTLHTSPADWSRS